MNKVLRLILLLGVALVVIISVAVLLNSYLKKSAIKNTANHFVSALLADNPTASYELFTKQTQTNESQESWKTEVNKLSDFFSGKKPSGPQISTGDSFTTAVYTITGDDGDYTFNLTLSKTEGPWRVVSFSSLPKT